MSLKVQDLMVSGVITARADEPIGSVEHLMQTHGVHAIPIVDDDRRPVGVVTSTDVLRDVVPGLPVSRIMTREVSSVSPSTEITEAARRMRKEGRHHLLVTRAGKVVGMLSTFDLLRLVEESGSAPQAGRERLARKRK